MTRVPFNPKTPIESFDPRFRNIWLRAALEPIVISFDSPRDAAAFQARLQNFRANLLKCCLQKPIEPMPSSDSLPSVKP